MSTCFGYFCSSSWAVLWSKWMIFMGGDGHIIPAWTTEKREIKVKQWLYCHQFFFFSLKFTCNTRVCTGKQRAFFDRLLFRAVVSRCCLRRLDKVRQICPLTEGQHSSQGSPQLMLAYPGGRTGQDCQNYTTRCVSSIVTAHQQWSLTKVRGWEITGVHNRHIQ